MNTHQIASWQLQQRRRYFLTRCGSGFGAVALTGLLNDEVPGRPRVSESSAADPTGPRKPHFAGAAKAVIHLFMAGAPSQLELFDNKPLLTKLTGKPLPRS